MSSKGPICYPTFPFVFSSLPNFPPSPLFSTIVFYEDDKVAVELEAKAGCFYVTDLSAVHHRVLSPSTADQPDLVQWTDPGGESKRVSIAVQFRSDVFKAYPSRTMKSGMTSGFGAECHCCSHPLSPVADTPSQTLELVWRRGFAQKYAGSVVLKHPLKMISDKHKTYQCSLNNITSGTFKTANVLFPLLKGNNIDVFWKTPAGNPLRITTHQTSFRRPLTITTS